MRQKDKDVIDETFDKMHDQGKMEWSRQPTPFSEMGKQGWDVEFRVLCCMDSSISFIWKFFVKTIFIILMQTLNTVIFAVLGYRYITIFDARGYFHQFLVKMINRHKLTLISHRGHKRSSIALIGYKGSPPYMHNSNG